MRSSYLHGCKLAAEKYALSSEALEQIVELVGLGLLAAPSAHHLMTDKKKSLGDVAEVGGLGALSLFPAHHLYKALKH